LSLAPGESLPLNTLGVVHYRAGRYEEAIAALQQSLAAANGLFDAYNQFFLAMAHGRLGHHDDARKWYDRGVRWLADQNGLDARATAELAAYRAEAAAVLAGLSGELPANIFAPEGP
jgi:tetratricopeptide (TPR) repeat protein